MFSLPLSLYLPWPSLLYLWLTLPVLWMPLPVLRRVFFLTPCVLPDYQCSAWLFCVLSDSCVPPDSPCVLPDSLCVRPDYERSLHSASLPPSVPLPVFCHSVLRLSANEVLPIAPSTVIFSTVFSCSHFHIFPCIFSFMSLSLLSFSISILRIFRVLNLIFAVQYSPVR